MPDNPEWIRVEDGRAGVMYAGNNPAQALARNLIIHDDPLDEVERGDNLIDAWQRMAVGPAIQGNPIPAMKKKPFQRQERSCVSTAKVREILFKHPNEEEYHPQPLKNIEFDRDKSIAFPNTFVGIEIEVENYDIGIFIEKVPNFEKVFQRHKDGSLRNNGVEYVSHWGARASEITPVLREFYAVASQSKLKFSFRCGLHIHVNALNHTMEDLYKIFLVYSVVEDLMFHISGKRYSNKFCLMVQKSVSSIGNCLHYGHANDWSKFMAALALGTKYMALNALPLRNYGTLEFRHHEGTCNPDVVRPWMQLLLELVERPRKLSKERLEKDVLDLNTVSKYGQFLETMFPDSCEWLQQIPNYERLMYDGVEYVKQCIIAEPDTLTGDIQ